MFSTPPPAPVQFTRKVIAAAERVARFERLRRGTTPIAVASLRGQFRAVIDQVMGEAGLTLPSTPRSLWPRPRATPTRRS